MNIRIPIKKIIFGGIILLLSSSFVFADEDRHLAVDQAIGGMEQGSRISAPDAKGTAPLTDVHKTISSSQGTKKGEPISSTVGSNHGNIYSAPGQTDNPVNAGVSQPEAEPITNPIDSGTGTGTQTEEPTTGSGDSGTGTSETSGNPIVDVDAGVDLESGTVEADATVDTTGELEDKEIFEADLEAESGDSTEESNPIIDTQAEIDLESGTVEADVTLDTSGELEEKQIIDADLAAGETAAEAEVGSATDVTQSDIVESADVTTQPVESVIPIPADLTAEVDTTGETSGGEADVGIEADVEGMSEGEDVTCDPADGLTSAACGLPQL